MQLSDFFLLNGLFIYLSWRAWQWESKNVLGKVGTKSSTDQKVQPSSFQALHGSSYLLPQWHQCYTPLEV